MHMNAEIWAQSVEQGNASDTRNFNFSFSSVHHASLHSQLGFIDGAPVPF